MALRQLILCLGDQLNRDAAVFDDFDKSTDAIWMAEVPEESTHVWSHKARITLFLSAMRHFAEGLSLSGLTVHYHRLGEHEHTSLASALAADLERLRPERVLVTHPGDYRVSRRLKATVRAAGLRLIVVRDRHFFDSPERFRVWARSRKQLRLENYYRAMRRHHGILMVGEEPVGGAWNFDADNRKSFGAEGPGALPQPVRFPPDATTNEVIADVERHFPGHPGRLDSFDWPVTAEQAWDALEDFINHRLPSFGPYQDALWRDEPWLYHSRLSAAMNLKLLAPRVVVNAAEWAWREGRAPLASVEGFIRQILGWREFVRGVYWLHMPDYLDGNALNAQADLPAFYWTGDTDMACLRQTLRQTLDHGYAHHIQRLMITGLYALLLGVEPRQVHEWYLAVYVDAVEWVEAPNTLGMSQFADGGVFASKPYCASGRYVQRMSNYCAECRYDPGKRSGDDACPFTTLYWDFLQRHEQRLRENPRTRMQIRNLERLDDATREAVRSSADWHRRTVSSQSVVTARS
ncbi:cryptochrome/photolyase family protein [Aquisalimonas sp.]|uniref:cryptochrome/photolyase family protein n=1 Tax=Aquisalimonas sp. TaxID=1872621 RepID=UPI0025BAD365|nr:cryptochrome/photolyase family protein [Aquisalimonas sp.]